MWPRKNKICYCKPENLLKKKIVCHIQSLDMHMLSLGFPNGSAGKERIWPMQETQGIGLPSLGQQDSLEKEMAPIAIFLPGKSDAQRSLAGLQRVRHDWMCVRVRVRAHAHTHKHTHTHAVTAFRKPVTTHGMKVCDGWVTLAVWGQLKGRDL